MTWGGILSRSDATCLNRTHNQSRVWKCRSLFVWENGRSLLVQSPHWLLCVCQLHLIWKVGSRSSNPTFFLVNIWHICFWVECEAVDFISDDLPGCAEESWHWRGFKMSNLYCLSPLCIRLWLHRKSNVSFWTGTISSELGTFWWFCVVAFCLSMFG